MNMQQGNGGKRNMNNNTVKRTGGRLRKTPEMLQEHPRSKTHDKQYQVMHTIPVKIISRPSMTILQGDVVKNIVQA